MVALGNRPGDVDAGVATVGNQVKRLRVMRGMTLEALAAGARVSVGLLSQLERGRGNPSFSTLSQIARALGVPLGRLFHTADVAAPVVRAGQRRSLDVHGPADNEALHELLSPGLNGTLEAFWIEAPPGYDTTGSPLTHPGEEFGIVLLGTHEVFLDGERFVLGAGDSITYDSSIPHWYRNTGDVVVHAVWVITPPSG